MTNSNDRRQDYLNQGQQDDYFDQELAIAGNAPPNSAVDDEYLNQGQQDDYFDQDLSVTGNASQDTAVDDEYLNQGQQDDYFDQDLTNRDRSVEYGDG